MSVERRHTISLYLAFLGMVLGFSKAWAAEDPPGGRYALVIGNSNYTTREKISGFEDGRLMKEYLEQLHFTFVKFVPDGTKSEMEAALEEFSKRISRASLVIFFYSGHGFQVRDRNYLLPTDGTINSADPGRMAMPLLDVVAKLGLADQAIKLIILDACRDDRQRPTNVNPGLAKLPAPPEKTTYAFAAAYGQVAASGPQDSLSPYSAALLNHLREAGLAVRDLFVQVRSEVLDKSNGAQEPRSEGLDAVPADLYLRDPVIIKTDIFDGPDDDLLVLLNGDIALNWGADERQNVPLRLKAGPNKLLILASNQKTFRNGQTWERTEGWHYGMNLLGEDGSELPCLEGVRRVPCFTGEEEVPFKDGPHHGKLFSVARANVYVDPATAEVTVRDRDINLWNSGAPDWARDQTSLYELRLRDFPGQGGLFGLGGFLGGILRLSGALDPDKTVITVRGNRSAQEPVHRCMDDPTKRSDRLSDLGKCIQAAIQGDPRPCDVFTTGLENCVGTRVWVDIEDRRRDPIPSSPSQTRSASGLLVFPGKLHGEANACLPAFHGRQKLSLTLPAGLTIDTTYQQPSISCCGGEENRNGSQSSVPSGLQVQFSGSEQGEWGIFNLKLIPNPGTTPDSGSPSGWTVEADLYCGPNCRLGATGCRVDMSASLAMKKE
jgi:hypothetical protein